MGGGMRDFLGGAILCGVAAVAIAYAVGGQAGPLCVDGHPAARRAGVTYGGLLARHGYQRDHLWPLCAGGPDTRSNVWYEPLAEAHRKDALEWRECEAMCRGEVSPDAVRDYFESDAWRDDLGSE
jgi:hypothetical protein